MSFHLSPNSIPCRGDRLSTISPGMHSQFGPASISVSSYAGIYNKTTSILLQLEANKQPMEDLDYRCNVFIVMSASYQLDCCILGQLKFLSGLQTQQFPAEPLHQIWGKDCFLFCLGVCDMQAVKAISKFLTCQAQKVAITVLGYGYMQQKLPKHTMWHNQGKIFITVQLLEAIDCCLPM